MLVDVLIDLTAATVARVETAIPTWQRPEHLGAVAGRVTIVACEPAGPAVNIPAEWRVVTSARPIGHFDAAMDYAGSRGVPLLVMLGLVEAGIEALGILRQALDADPMFGFAIPRVSCTDRCCIARLTRNGLGGSEWLPRAILGELPENHVLLETVSPCVLIAPQIAGNFGCLDAGVESVAGALLACMAAARRCGFRTVSSNRAVVSLAGVGCSTPSIEPGASLSRSDADQLNHLVPDLARSWEQSGAASAILYEELYSALPRPRTARSRPSLLVDVRNLAPLHNGTTHAILGLMTAFQEVADGWSISLLATDQGVAFHDLPRRFSGWPIHTEVPDSPFTVAFRPSQPWHLQELIDLHRVSILSACLLLDTIAWDVAYCAPPHLEGVWQFLATYADGLLYDSEFTRRRFLTRFPAGASLPGAVTHFSFDPSDYVESTSRGTDAESEGHILIVGNHLDHKDVRRTTRTLATAFPYRRIRVLGPTDIVSPLVSAVPSGTLATSEIDQLYAGAGCVVYPSFYEGFGFPILKALAYGRTVFVRRSALVDELAPLCHGRGRLVPFDRREDLVDLVGRLDEGQLRDGIEVGNGRRGASPRRWRDVASDTDRFLTSLIDDRSPSRWQARDRAVRQLISYRS